MGDNSTRRQRDLARTRQALLDGARQEVKQHGVGVSLDAIAASAGVSKGGLLHHFPNKDDLLLALAQDVFAEYEADVRRRAEAEPPSPGRLTKAYVQATLNELRDPDLMMEHITLFSLLSVVPVVSQFTKSEQARWIAELSDDGISPDVARVVASAADGAVGIMVTGQAPDALSITRLEENLMSLIDAHAVVEALFDRADNSSSP